MSSLQLVPLLALLVGWCAAGALDRYVVLLPGGIARHDFDAKGFCRSVEMVLPNAPLGTLLALSEVAAGRRAEGRAMDDEEEEEEEEAAEGDLLDNGTRIVNLVDLGLVPDLEFFERYLGNHPIKWIQPVHTGRPPRAARPQSGLSRLCRAVNRVPGLGAFCKRLVALAANNPLTPLLAVFNPGRRADEDVLAVMLYPEWRTTDGSAAAPPAPTSAGSICEMLLNAYAMSPPKALVALSSSSLPQLGFGLSRQTPTYLSFHRGYLPPLLPNYYLPSYFLREDLQADVVP